MREDTWVYSIANNNGILDNVIIQSIVNKLSFVLDYQGDSTDKNDLAGYLYALGNKILTFNYGEEADNYFKINSSPMWLSNRYIKGQWKQFEKWQKLNNKAVREREKDLRLFFYLLGEYSILVD